MAKYTPPKLADLRNDATIEDVAKLLRFRIQSHLGYCELKEAPHTWEDFPHSPDYWERTACCGEPRGVPCRHGCGHWIGRAVYFRLAGYRGLINEVEP